MRDARRIDVVAQVFGPAVTLAVVTLATAVYAQAPAPVERVTFEQAIDRAIANNPSTAVAAAGILRAEGLLRQARAATLLQVDGNVTTTTLNTGVAFEDTVVSPRHQVTGSLTLDQPIIAAAAWARRAQAQDNRQIAELSAAETRRQIAARDCGRLPQHPHAPAGPRREQPRARHGAGAFRSRDRARAAGDRQPPERAAGAAAAVHVRAAARVRLVGRVSGARSARRADRRERSCRCGRRAVVRICRRTRQRPAARPRISARSASVAARSEAVLRPAPGRRSAC